MFHHTGRTRSNASRRSALDDLATSNKVHVMYFTSVVTFTCGKWEMVTWRPCRFPFIWIVEIEPQQSSQKTPSIRFREMSWQIPTLFSACSADKSAVNGQREIWRPDWLGDQDKPICLWEAVMRSLFLLCERVLHRHGCNTPHSAGAQVI